MKARWRATTRSCASAVAGARRPRREDAPATACTPRSPLPPRRGPAARGGATGARRPKRGPMTGPLRVRMGLHTVSAELRDGDYYGTAVNRAGAARWRRRTVGRSCCRSPPRSSSATASRRRLSRWSTSASTASATSSRPERVFQLCAPGPPSRLSAAAVARRVPRQPSAATHVVRRSRATSSPRSPEALGESPARHARPASAASARRGSRSQVAADIAPELPGRRRGSASSPAARRPDAMLQVVAITLGVQTAADTSLEESHRRVPPHASSSLLVLDNCEHLLDAAARLADSVLRERAPACASLATSREGLAVEGEQIWALRSLPLPEPDGDLDDDRRERRGAACSWTRAAMARPTFALDAPNADGGRRDLPPARRRSRSRSSSRRRASSP